ncbi:MAG TPA: hypothetical protein V6D06_05155 [Trichocoleus sp.]
MAALARSIKQPRRRRKALWFERIMALLALVNLGLVAFDLSYVRFRDGYLQLEPELTRWYGTTVKGIVPERSTTGYLATVAELENQVAQTGLQSAEAQEILQQLQQQSVAMIDENPFQIAGKSGTLERIKSTMRSHLNTDSSREAFLQFWSPSRLRQQGWSGEIAFFNAQIKPLIETNFYRGIAFDGGPTDWFWRIDACFIGLFVIELIARSFYLSQRYKNVAWIDTILWRWYDLLLIIPFSALRMPALALSRIIPVVVRLNQARLLDLEPLRNRVNRFLVSQVAIELTEMVVLRIIDQMQNSVRNGDVAHWVLDTRARYIDINGVNELEVISERLSTVLIDEVLPKVKPEIDALLDHTLSRALDQAPGYQGLRQLPGVSSLSDQIARQLIGQVTDNVYQTLKRTSKDDRGAQLLQSLVSKLVETLRTEIKQTEGTIEEIQAMTVALLEEIKLNYVKRLATEDLEALAEERYRLYDVSQRSGGSKKYTKPAEPT